MTTTLTTVLSDHGIPSACPTCNCPVWNVRADTHHGITSVICEECRRSYVRGSSRDRLIQNARDFTESLYRANNGPAIRDAYNRLVASYYFWQERPDDSVLYLESAGAGGEDHANDLPF